MKVFYKVCLTTIKLHIKINVLFLILHKYWIWAPASSSAWSALTIPSSQTGINCTPGWPSVSHCDGGPQVFQLQTCCGWMLIMNVGKGHFTSLQNVFFTQAIFLPIHCKHTSALSLSVSLSCFPTHTRNLNINIYKIMWAWMKIHNGKDLWQQ